MVKISYSKTFQIDHQATPVVPVVASDGIHFVIASDDYVFDVTKNGVNKKSTGWKGSSHRCLLIRVETGYGEADIRYACIDTENKIIKFIEAVYDNGKISIEIGKQIQNDEFSSISIVEHGLKIANLMVMGNIDDGKVVEMTEDGDYITWDTGFGSYGVLGFGIHKIWMKIVNGEVHVHGYMGRHLAGDPHRIVCFTKGKIVKELEATGGGSPRPYLGAPLYTTSRILFPLTNAGVDSSTNNVDWYYKDTKLFSTKPPTSFSTYATVALFPVGIDSDGYIHSLWWISNVQYLSRNTKVEMVYAKIDSKGNVIKIASLKTYDSGDPAGNIGHPEIGGNLDVPLVDTKNKMMYMVFIGMNPSTGNVYADVVELDISDQDIRHWNQYAWILDSYKVRIPTVLTLTVTVL